MLYDKNRSISDCDQQLYMQTLPCAQAFQAHQCVHFSVVCEHSATLYNDSLCVCACVVISCSIQDPECWYKPSDYQTENYDVLENICLSKNLKKKKKKGTNISNQEQKTEVYDIFIRCSNHKVIYTPPTGGEHSDKIKAPYFIIIS